VRPDIALHLLDLLVGFKDLACKFFNWTNCVGYVIREISNATVITGIPQLLDAAGKADDVRLTILSLLQQIAYLATQKLEQFSASKHASAADITEVV